MGPKKSLTDRQERIVNKKRLYAVKARPGSGKTFAVAAKFAKLLKDWEHSHQGIAVISFTNSAWKEINRALSEDFAIKTPVSYPHFLGTIDSFFNQYVFLPFGHLIMGCDRRPQLIGPPVNNWSPLVPGKWRNHECNSNMCSLNEFTFDINDSLVSLKKISHFNNCHQKHSFCMNEKLSFIKKGYATQSDARYFTLKVLQTSPQIAKALTYRFPIMIMDEAQDTSDVEMKAIDTLIENELKEVMLIGNTEQAIFEWRDARPDLFEDKYKQWENNSLTLDENWRSSQIICNFFNEISDYNSPPIAVNDSVKDSDLVPQIWEYPKDAFDRIISDFLDICSKHNVGSNPDDIAILARSADIVKAINGTQGSVDGRKEPWNDEKTRFFCESKYLFDSKKFKPAFSLFEKVVCQVAMNLPFCRTDDLEAAVSEYGFVNWRKEIYKLLSNLPETSCSLKEWVDRANECIHYNNSLLNDIELKIKKRSEYYNMSFNELFGENLVTPKCYFKAGTIHSIKGETLGAVLAVFKNKAGDRHEYKTVLNDHPLNSEELRIIYVVITRPRRILVVAVPEGDGAVWKKKFGIC
jgi:superfamily I DNA/RNA helicase